MKSRAHIQIFTLRRRYTCRTCEGERTAMQSGSVSSVAENHDHASVAQTPSGLRSELVPAFTPTRELSAHLVLRESGLGRLRVMAFCMLLLVSVGVLVAALLDAPRSTKLLAWGALGFQVALFGWMWRRLDNGMPLDARGIRLVSMPLCVSVVIANYAFGLVSAFCAGVALGMLLFSSSTGRRNARLAYAAIAVLYAACSASILLGWIPYAPLVPSPLADGFQRATAFATVEALYFGAYFAGRMLRRELARVVEQFERAVRDASHREALLREARDAFRRVSGLGNPGRFTEHELDGFRLGVVIGRGGMGEVYAAEHVPSGQKAAVKLLRLDVLGEKNALSRFEREARIVASVRSPHVVRVLGVSGSDAVFPYIAMEQLNGVDLATYLRDRGRLPLPEVAELIRQVAKGLNAAHRAQVVHRDLKPNNLFRETDAHGAPLWKIVDFGVSKLLGSEEASLTAVELVGTPQYMSPEQVRGERDVDLRADLYALSAIAYRALTGEPPFTGELPGILRSVAERMPRAPSAFVGLPLDVDLVLAIGLAKRREQRFAGALELAGAFLRAVRGQLPERWRDHARALLVEHPYAN